MSNATDLKQASLNELVYAAALLAGRFLELGLSLLDDPGRSPGQILEDFGRLGRLPEVAFFNRLAQSPNLSQTLWDELIDTSQARAEVNHEFIKRVIKNSRPAAALFFAPLCQELLGLLPDDEAVRAEKVMHESLEKAFHIDRLSDYRDADCRDIRGVAIEAIFEQVRQEQLAAFEFGWSLTRSFVPMMAAVDVLDKQRWCGDFSRRALYRRAFISILVFYWPLLGAERLPAVARTGWRDYTEGREAKKRGGTGGRHARTVGTKEPKALEVGFDVQPRLAAPDVTEDVALSRIEADRLLQKVQERFGAKGRRFFEEVASGAGIEEAAHRAGISRQTGHSYIRKLADELK